jgi:long-chain acyl-CoA synthetase
MSPEDGNSTLKRILAHGLEREDAEALRCGASSLGWGELRSTILSVAGHLRPVMQNGGGRVALLGGASAELVIAYLATIAAGGCAVPLPVSAHRDALAGMLTDCEPDLIIAHEDALSMLEGIANAPVVSVRPGEGVPEELIAAPLEAPVPVPGDTPFNIIYSSGTTGRPKGIVHSHTMRYRQSARSLFGLGPDCTMLLATPLYSNTTLMPLLAALFHGARVILMPKFDAEAYLDVAETERATHTMLVPVQYQRVLAVDGFDRRDLSAFRIKQSTGAPLHARVKQALLERWPGRFLDVYGLTEGGCTCILDLTAFPHKAHTVGRPAEEASRAFYWHDAEGNLFHRTGDIGMFDEDGFVVLVDRRKDMIISGGFNIYASDLEEKLLSHPDVSDAAVIAVPSERWGETPLGFIVPRNGAGVDPQAVLEWTNAQLGRMQRLSAVEVRDELPRSPVGKVLKQELRKPYWEKRP